MKKIILIAALAITGQLRLSAQSIDSLKLKDTEIPKEYSLTKESQCISIQACTFYDKPEMYEMFLGKLKRKDVQNFESKKDNGSIMYFEYDGKFKGDGFIQALIWGEDHPTKEHPEDILIKENLLIIWSFAQNSSLKKISQVKIKGILK